jgi:DNA-binding MarR family transcriptional regulator
MNLFATALPIGSVLATGKGPSETLVLEMHSPKLKQADYTALAEFRFALRCFLEFSENEARKIGLTPQQHQALLVIKGYGRGEPFSVGDLAERLRVRHHSAVELVHRLNENGLVVKRQDAEDHRRVLLELSTEAEALLERLSAVHLGELSRIEPMLQRALSRSDLAGERRHPQDA